MTSLQSRYESGDDEEEIFSLVDPDQHPDTVDDHDARQEQERLANRDYDVVQDELDESESLSPHLIARLQGLSEDQLAELDRFIDKMQSSDT